jgi:type VI secretion system protein VasI
MTSLTRIGLSFCIAMVLTAPLARAEQAPPCSDQTIGISCVVMRDTVGDWQLEEVKPPVGSQNSLVAFVESFQEMPGLFNRPKRAELVLSCIENTTNIQFRFGENYMSDVGEFATLIYKLDDQPPVPLQLQASPDNDALGLYSGGAAIPVINKLIGADRLFVSATTFTGRPLTASFQVTDMEEALVPLRELCNW